jgi:hypothetical protein
MCAVRAGSAWQATAPQQPKASAGSLLAAPALHDNGMLLIGFE